MRISLVVRDAGTTDRETLYNYLVSHNVHLPDGALVSLPFGDDGEHSITESVVRSFFDPADAEHPVHVELTRVYLDQPTHWPPGGRYVSTWWRDSFDGTTRTPEEFSRHVHEGLRLGGWKRYGE